MIGRRDITRSEPSPQHRDRASQQRPHDGSKPPAAALSRGSTRDGPAVGESEQQCLRVRIRARPGRRRARRFSDCSIRSAGGSFTLFFDDTHAILSITLISCQHTAYRIWGGPASQCGYWWILAPPDDCVDVCPRMTALQLETTFAVCPEWNDMTNITAANIPVNVSCSFTLIELLKSDIRLRTTRAN